MVRNTRTYRLYKRRWQPVYSGVSTRYIDRYNHIYLQSTYQKA